MWWSLYYADAMFPPLYWAIFRSNLQWRKLYSVLLQPRWLITTSMRSRRFAVQTDNTGYAISPRPMLTMQRLEPHACIEHLVTSRPLWILHTTVHLRDMEVYPRLSGNLLSSTSLRNITYAAKFETLSIPHATGPIYTRHFDNLIGLTPTPLYHVLL